HQERQAEEDVVSGVRDAALKPSEPLILAGATFKIRGKPSGSLQVPDGSDHPTADSPRKEFWMAHVVAEPCFDCKYTDCVFVCPLDCFYDGAQMRFIHSEECSDCEACVPECRLEAIFHEDNLPDEWKEFTALNAEESRKCPVITEKKDALEGES